MRMSRLPLRWVVIVGTAGRRFRWCGVGRWKFASGRHGAGLVGGQCGRHSRDRVGAVYVKPSASCRLKNPYIERHIAGHHPRPSGSGDQKPRTMPFVTVAQEERRQTSTLTRPLVIDNIRLWDWRAFKRHDHPDSGAAALLPLRRHRHRPLSSSTARSSRCCSRPREVDVHVNCPAETRASWPIRNLSYTHGYGVVMSEVNRTTPDGLPVLLIQDAPPSYPKVPDIQLTRPEIYYGEVTHDPVFVGHRPGGVRLPFRGPEHHLELPGPGRFPDQFVAAAAGCLDPTKPSTTSC